MGADPGYADIRWWNVATINVEKLDYTVAAGDGSAQQAYRVQILGNEKEQSHRLQYRDLPTREDVGLELSRREGRRYYRRVELVSEQGSKDENNWTLQQYTCSSTCRIEKGDRESC